MGPAPMTRHDSSARGAPAVHGVAADGQRLHQGELVERQFPRRVELAGRQEELRAHPAVAVDARTSSFSQQLGWPRRLA
jgi:hypothetical protein